MIYLDNAATTMRKPPQVAEAVFNAMNTMGNASRGAHQEALAASRVVYDTRVKLAELFHCSRADHVVFTCNSTEALNIAINGTVNPGSHVITTMMEHNSVLRPLFRLQEEQHVSLDFVQCDDLGNPVYEQFESLLTPKTRAIVCTHASNLTGNSIDLQRVGRFAKDHGLLFIVDASQTAGVIPPPKENQKRIRRKQLARCLRLHHTTGATIFYYTISSFVRSTIMIFFPNAPASLNMVSILGFLSVYKMLRIPGSVTSESSANS